MDRRKLEEALVQIWRETSTESEKILTGALVVLCDFHQKHLDPTKVHLTWNRLQRLVKDLPDLVTPVVVYHSDARALPVDSESIDLVLTSPPYLNVLNYHQKFRRSVEALDWDILPVARSEIGSNRQNRSNRFLTVVQYSLDMALAIREAVRVTKPGGRLIFVLGRESVVRGTRFYNGELVAELAVKCIGLPLERRQERVFMNRYGLRIVEDILHFAHCGSLPSDALCLRTARDLAGKVLARTLSSALAPRKERQGLIDALERISAVTPSPLLAPPTSSTSPKALT